MSQRSRFSLFLLIATGMLSACAGSNSSMDNAVDLSPLPGTWWPAESSDRWFPVAALMLPTGEMIVADTDQNRLFRMRAAEATPSRLPSPGQGTVSWTALAAAPGLSFYALDGPGRLVQQYDLQGNYVGVALDIEAMSVKNNLGPVEPGGLAVDRSGHALITDRLGDRILAFGPGWSFLGVWGQTGTDPGSWRRPGSVAVGSRAPYLVSDTGNQRIVLLDGLGDVIATRDLPSLPQGVTALPEGRFAVSYGRVIEVMDAGLGTLETHTLPLIGNCEGGPFVTTALTGSRELLFIGEGCSGRVLQVSLGGE